jgi:hypothetical protein
MHEREATPHSEGVPLSRTEEPGIPPNIHTSAVARQGIVLGVSVVAPLQGAGDFHSVTQGAPTRRPWATVCHAFSVKIPRSDSYGVPRLQREDSPQRQSPVAILYGADPADQNQ